VSSPRRRAKALDLLREIDRRPPTIRPISSKASPAPSLCPAAGRGHATAKTPWCVRRCSVSLPLRLTAREPRSPPARRDVGFALDSLLEGTGFEPSVPRDTKVSRESTRRRRRAPFAGLMVRIRFPPAASRMRTRLIHLRAYPPVSRTPATSGPMRSRLWAGSGGTRSRFISIEPQYRWSSTSVVVRALLRTIGGTFRRPGRRSQPPQATAPLWANRGHDGRSRIVEKWKR
jgi:hypothetical protein